MSYVILVRNPRSDGVLVINHHERPDEAAVFPTRKAAQKVANEQILCKAWPYSIVEAP